MKPKFLRFPLLALALASSAMAGQFIWTGAADSTWTNASNWDTTTTPPTTPGAELTFPAYGTDYTADNMRIANGAGAGAVFNPGSNVTTTFRSSRGIIIGGGAAADLTVSSGTIAVINAGGSGQEPLMANGVSANLLINGGAIDTTGSSLPFRLVHTGAEGLTSTMTISSGSFSATTIDLFAGTALGESTINLDGGVIAVNRFLKNQGATDSTIHLNGGTLRARNNNENYLNALGGLSVIVKEGGGTIDTNGFNITVSANIEHDPALGTNPDGGLIKTGGGTLTLNNANSFNGGLTINQGRAILAGTDTSPGTGTITLGNTGAEVQIGGGRNFANPFVVSDTGDLKTMLFVGTPGSTLSGEIAINESTPGNFRVQVNDERFLTVNGKITGTGAAGIHKVNPGWLNLRNPDNDFTGGVKITGGILNFDNGSLGSTGPITMDSGTLRWRPGFANEDVSARLVMVDGVAARLNTGDETTFVSFSESIGNNSTASLVKLGSGILTLTQANTYTGETTVLAGTLRVNGSLDASSNVTVTGGAIGGTGSINGPVTLGASGSIAPGAGASAGTLTIGGNLDVSAAAADEATGTLRFGLDALAATSDRIMVGGTLTIGPGELGFGDFQFTNLGGLEEGTYTLINASVISGTLDAGNLGGSIGGFDGTLNIVGNSLVLQVAPGTGSPYTAWSGGEPFDGDANSDGVANGVAWVLGAANPNANAIGLLPDFDNASDPSYFIYTYRRLVEANEDANTTIAVQYSGNLSNWTTATAGPNVIINVTNNIEPGIDEVEVKINRTLATGGRLFVRLNVDNNAE